MVEGGRLKGDGLWELPQEIRQEESKGSVDVLLQH